MPAIGHCVLPVCWAACRRSAVDLAAMTDADDVYQEQRIEDLVDDPVVTNSNPIDRVLALHRHTVRWPGVVGQQIKCRADPLLLATLQRGERSQCPPCKPDLVRCIHDRPRSALTCSHGM